MQDKTPKKDNSVMGLYSSMLMIIPILVNHKSEEVDNILQGILNIRQAPEDQRPELTADLVAAMSKDMTTRFMQKMSGANIENTIFGVCHV